MSSVSFILRCIAIVLSLVLFVAYLCESAGKPHNSRASPEPRVSPIVLIRPSALDSQSTLDNELFGAIEMHDLEKAKSLIRAGANVNSKDEQGWRPLMRAAYQSPAMTRLLIQNRADINGRNNSRETALFWASPDVLPILLQYGADMEAKDTFGVTALLKAAYSCGGCGCGTDLETVTVLLAHGANPNARADRGDTALIRAALAMVEDVGGLKVIRLLLTHRANVNLRDYKGRTALSIIRQYRKENTGQDDYSRQLQTTFKQAERLLLRAGAHE